MFEISTGSFKLITNYNGLVEFDKAIRKKSKDYIKLYETYSSTVIDFTKPMTPDECFKIDGDEVMYTGDEVHKEEIIANIPLNTTTKNTDQSQH